MPITETELKLIAALAIIGLHQRHFGRFHRHVGAGAHRDACCSTLAAKLRTMLQEPLKSGNVSTFGEPTGTIIVLLFVIQPRRIAMTDQVRLAPEAQLSSLITGRFLTQAVGACVELGLVDPLANGPLAAEEVARRTHTHAPSVYRLFRMLAMVGVLDEHDGQRFSLTPVGQLLRSDVPGSLAGMARFMAQGWHAHAWAHLPHSIKTGEPGFPVAHGAPMFKWFPEHRAEGEIFHQAMTAYSGALGHAVLASYDFSRFGRIADIGGGHGMLLSMILGKTSGATGIVFDLPEVVHGAAPTLQKAGISSRCDVVGGDFFEGVPAGFDAYVMKHIIHDWSDERAATILRHCAAGLNPNGRVLLVEMVVPPAGTPSFGKILDLEMLVMTEGGRERTEAEFGALFASAGLKLERVVATPSPVSVIEASRV